MINKSLEINELKQRNGLLDELKNEEKEIDSIKIKQL